MKQDNYRESHIKKLLHPASVAVIGASGKRGRVGHIIFKRLLGFDGELYPVNPKEPEVLGVTTFPSVSDIPFDVDTAIITVSAEKSVDIAEECTRKGIESIIIVASGFGETGAEGKRLEERLKSIATRYDCRILGPNSLGIFIPETGFDTIFVEHGDKSLAGGGGIAFVTQSGSVGVESLGLAGNTGFGMRAFVGLGNKIDLSELDFLRYFGTDSATDCLAFYIESMASGRVFLEEAKEVSRNKPVIVLKAGRTPAGAHAAASHTGRLAGSDRVVSGAFRQYGLQRAYDDEELCDAARTLSNLPPARGNRVAVLTGAGGFGVMCTDYIESRNPRARLEMAELSGDTVGRILSMAPPFASCTNPVDLTAGMDNKMFTRTLEALMGDPGADIIICIAFFAPPTITDDLVDDIARTVRSSEKPVLVFTEYGPFTEKYLKSFYDKGVIGFSSLHRTVRAARFLVERGKILTFFGGDV